MGINEQNQEIQSLVNDIKEGRLLLPEMQRGYVWKSTQVRDLFDSLYHEYPTGQLLIWQTDELPLAHAPAVQGVDTAAYHPQLLLDGQQRLTSLTAILFGDPVVVRDRTRKVDIVFNVFDKKEPFEVATAVHHPQAGWVSLTKLFTLGTIEVFKDLKLDFSDPTAQLALDRLMRLYSIRQYKYRITVLEGLTYEEVTEIFVRINSGGTRLSTADLALAQISSRWKGTSTVTKEGVAKEGITNELDTFRQEARQLGWELDNSMLLRVLTGILTGQSRFSSLFKSERDALGVDDIKAAWARSVSAMRAALQFLIHSCGIDRLSMMPTYSILIPLAAFFDKHGANVTEKQARDLQRWVYMALIWSRYTGAAETFMDEDLAAVMRDDQPIERMIENIVDKVGQNRVVTERELQDQLSNTPSMLMAYLLARRNHATDWFNGIAIGPGQPLEYHHIFPRAVLATKYDMRAHTRLVNQVANLAFISQHANAKISASLPASYLPAIETSRLQAQYVPTDASLWSLDRYEDFVRQRRELLASAINDLLASLMDEPAPWVSDMSKQLESRVGAVEQELRDLIDQRLTINFGPQAWKRCVPNEIQDQVQGRIDQRVRRNPFEANQYESLGQKLTQCNFGDYAQIIAGKANWPCFADVFGSKATFEQQMQPIKDARNAFAHRRELNEGEQHAAAGGLYWLEQCLRRAARAVEEAEEPEQDADVEPAAVVARETHSVQND